MNVLAETSAPISSAVNRVYLPRRSLAGCVRGVMTRDTRHAGLAPAQNFNYFPASPLCSISWWIHGRAERVLGPFPERPVTLDDPREPIDARIVLGGPFNLPSASWNPGPMQGVMLMLTPDALRLMTGFDPAAHLNRLSDVRTVLPPEWCAFCEALLADPDDAARVRRIEDFLEPRWQAVRPREALAHRYQEWMEGLAMRAAQTAAGSSLRQLERRIKLWAGQPMRELQGVSKLERAFFDAVAAEEAGRLNFASLAVDSGYADQAHLTRVTRRMTGFAPAELNRRIHSEEPFWAYRAWM
ncbi:MAG TPA: helix-turn-helix domain-containing protein [Burkholderiaceae bacterium]